MYAAGPRGSGSGSRSAGRSPRRTAGACRCKAPAAGKGSTFRLELATAAADLAPSPEPIRPASDSAGSFRAQRPPGRGQPGNVALSHVDPSEAELQRCAGRPPFGRPGRRGRVAIRPPDQRHRASRRHRPGVDPRPWGRPDIARHRHQRVWVRGRPATQCRRRIRRTPDQADRREPPGICDPPGDVAGADHHGFGRFGVAYRQTEPGIDLGSNSRISSIP